MRAFSRSLVVLALLAVVPAAGHAQIPDEFQNLQVLPDDIPRDSLIQIMRSFSFATGLRCEGCHVMGEGGSFRGPRFHLDEKPNKEKARYMLRMVGQINDELLAELPHRDDPPLRVECKTCHRGLNKPFLLRTELHRVIDEEGVEAAVERYRLLREHEMDEGRYDFGEWEMNELARELVAQGQVEAGVAMLELNEEFHPTSPSIPRTLAPLYEELGRTQDAIAAWARTLGRNPGDGLARERLRELTGEGGG